MKHGARVLLLITAITALVGLAATCTRVVVLSPDGDGGASSPPDTGTAADARNPPDAGR